MQFNALQHQRFGTSQGAYSVVTNREFYDSQITLTDYEANLLMTYFGQQNIHVGNVKSNPSKAAKPLRLYPNGQTIHLNIVYPKPNKTELRLYISKRAGFKPTGGLIWFLFIKNEELWIGSMEEHAWRAESSILKQDETDDVYQQHIQQDTDDEVRLTTLKARDIYQRDRKLALQRIENAAYQCEFDPNHPLFISRFTRKRFLEVHHLIPLSLQENFDTSLDTLDNLVCLCPHCHRAVHHAEEPMAREILSTLANKRPLEQRYAVDTQTLFGLYAVEEID